MWRGATPRRSASAVPRSPPPARQPVCVILEQDRQCRRQMSCYRAGFRHETEPMRVQDVGMDAIQYIRKTTATALHRPGSIDIHEVVIDTISRQALRMRCRLQHRNPDPGARCLGAEGQVDIERVAAGAAGRRRLVRWHRRRRQPLR